MSASPLVSVVMPVRNGGDTLQQALESVARQTYANLELVIVDDGSDRPVDSVIRSLTLANVRLHRFETGRGIAAALNMGISLASGEFIARFDGDDEMYPHRIEQQIRYLLDHSDVAILGSGADTFGDYNIQLVNPLAHQKIVDSFLVQNPMIHPTVVFNRRRIEPVYPEEFPTDEDYLLWATLIPIVEFANLNSSTIRYRVSVQGNHWHLGKKAAKIKAVQTFLANHGVSDPELISAIVDLQISGLVNKAQFQILQDYRSLADQRNLPRLGRFHKPLQRSRSYRDFAILSLRA